MKLLSLVTIVILAVHLASCAGTAQMYQGTKQSPENIALIKGREQPTRSIAVKRVDGVELGFNNINAEVLPGVRHITVVLVRMKNPLVTYKAYGTFILNAQAGHTYQVWGEIIDEDNVRIWVEDESTGEIVAGSKAE